MLSELLDKERRKEPEMLKASQIDTTNVTGEQIGHCSKWVEGKVTFYLVENENGKLDPETFEIIEYRVSHTIKQGFSCTCEAGKHGFSNCRLGVCKHVVWAIACEKEVRAAFKLIEEELAAEKALALAAKEEEEKKAVKELAAKELAAKYPRAAKGDLQSKPFSFMAV